MKSNIASFVVALEEFVGESNHSPPVSLGVMIAGDEEAAPNRGTANIVRHLKSIGRTLDYCIVTEPTFVAHLDDTIKNGRRDSAWGHINIQGIQGHPAYPERAKNPIQL